MSLQTATKVDFAVVISYWFRHYEIEYASALIDSMAEWPEAAQLCSFANVWRGLSEPRYGLFMGTTRCTKDGFNSLSTSINYAALTETRQLWKLIHEPSPESQESQSTVYLQHLESGHYLCRESGSSDYVVLRGTE